MPRKRTHEEFIDILSRVNKNIEIQDKYIGAHTKIRARCKLDNHIWMESPNNLIRGSGCPECRKRNLSHRFRKDEKEFLEEIKEVSPNIKIIGEYVNCKTHIEIKCKVCGWEWEMTPSNLLRGYGCPRCAKQLKDKTTEYFKWELKKINKNIEIIGEYIGAKTSIELKCKICGNEWMNQPTHLLNGQGCPKCNSSKGEKAIEEILNELSINHIREYRFKNCRRGHYTLPFDFYLPEYNTCIEYDGKQHFEPIEYFGGGEAFATRQKNDRIKNNYCKNNKIKLIRVPYTTIDIKKLILEHLDNKEDIQQLSIL